MNKNNELKSAKKDNHHISVCMYFQQDIQIPVKSTNAHCTVAVYVCGDEDSQCGNYGNS